MKTLKAVGFGSLMLLAGAINSNAWFTTGHVLCDANQNGLLDSNDSPLPGVLIVVTNLSGTYSNADWTTFPDGGFVLALPATPDTYVEYIHPLTLPAGGHVTLPSSGAYQFTLSTSSDLASGDFLITSPTCQTNCSCPPPPPPVQGSNGCWLTGGGVIRTGTGKPQFTFGGNVFPGCSPTAGGGGNWNVVAHTLNLHFQGTMVQEVSCGNVPGIPPGSKSPKTPYNYIDFQGVGTLKGIGGNKTNAGLVYFFARAEDRGEPGKNDRLYLRVYGTDGSTLLLISSDSANPMNVATTQISSGNLQIHASSCP